ncbi:MAG: preprotein translocase subunit SecY [Planctomycetota bacterium]
MSLILKVFRDVMGIPDLRRRILITFGLLAVYRIGFHIYLPGVNITVLDQVIKALEESAGGGLLNAIRITSALTGGQLNSAMLFSLGIMPYISASIIFSLLVKVFPRLEALQKEGESGRRQINRYTRYATVVLCLIQACFVIYFLRSPQPQADLQTISYASYWWSALQVLCLTAGCLFLMWLGEKITEFGIGNGVSLIIMAGIIAQLPSAVLGMIAGIQAAPADEVPFKVLQLVGLVGLFFAVVLAVVYITKAQRRIPVQQARTVKGRKVYGGQRHYMPIKVNAAGVLPIIFAQSLIVLPSAVLGAIPGTFGTFLAGLLATGGVTYTVLYVAMIGFFTYFWVSLMFNPVEIADQMKEYGSFVPGIRPGKRTAEYLSQIISRITLTGASFLAAIALFPQLVSTSLGVDQFIAGFLGGTGILIVVGVALDLVDKVEAQLLVRHYEGFMGPGGGSGGGGGAATPPKAKASS